MKRHCGFTIYGNLPALVYLNMAHALDEAVEKGYDATMDLIERTGLNHHYLISISGNKEEEYACL